MSKIEITFSHLKRCYGDSERFSKTDFLEHLEAGRAYKQLRLGLFFVFCLFKYLALNVQLNTHLLNDQTSQSSM